MFMKTSEGFVKLEPDDNFQTWTGLNVGPFKVDHGSGEKKMVFVPSQGNWTNFQNAKYAAYILGNKNRMEGRSHARLWQLYKEMSLFIGSRNFRQCKTHHQRLTQISPSFTAIVNYLKNTIDDFDTLLTMQIESYKNFATPKSYPQFLPEDAHFKSTLDKDIKPTDQKITSVPTADQYLSQPMKGFPLMMNQGMIGGVFPCMPSYQQMKSSAEEWLQCHNLFVQWTKKLQQLNSMSFHY